jgi:hypothetical protein
MRGLVRPLNRCSVSGNLPVTEEDQWIIQAPAASSQNNSGAQTNSVPGSFSITGIIRCSLQ